MTRTEKKYTSGDILDIKGEAYKYVVKFHDGCFMCVDKYDEHFEQAKLLKDVFSLSRQVIGNEFDNPELLGE